MPLTNTRRNWGTLAKLFHWVIAVLVLANLGLGYWADDLASSPTKADAFYWHKTIGLTVLWLALLRLLWRLTNPKPRLPPEMAAWQRGLAHVSHFLLYVLLFAMPLSGWAIHSTAEATLLLYGLYEVPSILPSHLDQANAERWAKTAHYWLFIAICGLVSLHVLGALKHHFVNGDKVLLRMMPFTRATDPIRGQ